jgi:hypothetical protein
MPKPYSFFGKVRRKATGKQEVFTNREKNEVASKLLHCPKRNFWEGCKHYLELKPPAS